MATKPRVGEPQMSANDPKKEMGEYIEYEEIESRNTPPIMIFFRQAAKRAKAALPAAGAGMPPVSLPAIPVGAILQAAVKSGLAVGHVVGHVVVFSFAVAVHVVAIVLRVVHLVALALVNECRGLSFPEKTHGQPERHPGWNTGRRPGRQSDNGDDRVTIHNHINIH